MAKAMTDDEVSTLSRNGRLDAMTDDRYCGWLAQKTESTVEQVRADIQRDRAAGRGAQAPRKDSTNMGTNSDKDPARLAREIMRQEREEAAMSADDIAVCRSLGITHEKFLAQRAVLRRLLGK